MLFACEKKEKTSQYKGVFWHREKRKWCIQLQLKGQKQKQVGAFKNELDAANVLNQLCEDFGIPLKNPAISMIPNQQNQVTKQFILSHGIIQKSEL